MLVMQFKIIPLSQDAQGIGSFEGSSNSFEGVNVEGGASVSSEQLARPFLYMLIIQGVFSGLAIGKLSEDSVKAGIKHSFIMSIAAFLIATGAKLLL